MICNLPCQRYPTKQEIPDVRDAYACEQDLAKRRETRLKYPGACSIEYQNAISIFTECLLRWDKKNRKQSEEEGLLGTVVAFAPAHKEQGRNTLQCSYIDILYRV